MNDTRIADRPDVIVIGSGFGGSVAALRLTEKGYQVTVLEAGRHFADEDLAGSPWELHRVVWAPRLGLRGIIRIRLRRRFVALTGIGLGGGSLAYAGVHYRPSPETFRAPGWDTSLAWPTELAPWFDRAERMLGTTTAPGLTPGDRVLRRTADTLGTGSSFHPTRVGIHFGPPAQLIPDPYFDGRGPDRYGCTQCGQCTIGCRIGAKNTLTKNYLHLAEHAGARIQTLTTATLLCPRPEGGWHVHTVRSGAVPGVGHQVWSASQVVLAAGAWGSTELLHRSRAAGALPELSPALGTRICTNGEIIHTVRAKDFEVGSGVAISSAFHPDSTTTVQLCRVGSGRHPLTGGRRAERTAFLNTMMREDHTLASNYRRGRMNFHPLTHSSTPADHAAAGTFALDIGGRAHRWGNTPRWLPVTAHLLGGCPLGADRATSVVDCHHRIHGYPTLHITDGSTIPYNLGVTKGNVSS